MAEKTPGFPKSSVFIWTLCSVEKSFIIILKLVVWSKKHPTVNQQRRSTQLLSHKHSTLRHLVGDGSQKAVPARGVSGLLLSWFSLKFREQSHRRTLLLYDPIRLLLPRLLLVQVRLRSASVLQLVDHSQKQRPLWSQLKPIDRAQRPGRMGVAPILTWECQTCSPSWEQTTRCSLIVLHLLYLFIKSWWEHIRRSHEVTGKSCLRVLWNVGNGGCRIIETETYLNGLEDERVEIQVRSENTTLNHSQL